MIRLSEWIHRMRLIISDLNSLTKYEYFIELTDSGKIASFDEFIPSFQLLPLIDFPISGVSP